MTRTKKTLMERTLVAVLFVLVLIIFSLAQRDSKRLQYLYTLSHTEKTNTGVGKK